MESKGLYRLQSSTLQLKRFNMDKFIFNNGEKTFKVTAIDGWHAWHSLRALPEYPMPGPLYNLWSISLACRVCGADCKGSGAYCSEKCFKAHRVKQKSLRLVKNDTIDWNDPV